MSRAVNDGGGAILARGSASAWGPASVKTQSITSPAAAAAPASPLLSVIMFVLNGMPHVQRAAKSVLTQGHDNLEFVIQDGGSTDGTVEYLQSLKDPRIKLVSKKDNGPADAFAAALSRCRGAVIATCLFDEELMPGALERAVQLFAEHPYLGAITGDAHISDIWGDVYAKFEGAPFNLIKYLNGEYCPYWCSSFFNVEALRFIGLFDNRWSKSSLEFEIWVRLAMETDILYVPEIFSKYAHHAGQLSQAGGRVQEEIEARLEIIRKHLFGPGKYFGETYFRCDIFCLLQLINLHRHMSTWNPPEAEKVLQRIIDVRYLGEFNASRALPASRGEVVLSDLQTQLQPQSMQQMQTPMSLPAASEMDKPQSPLLVPDYIIIEQRGFGKVYRALTPRFIRAMLPYDAKLKLAYALGLRKRAP